MGEWGRAFSLEEQGRDRPTVASGKSRKPMNNVGLAYELKCAFRLDLCERLQTVASFAVSYGSFEGLFFHLLFCCLFDGL